MTEREWLLESLGRLNTALARHEAVPDTTVAEAQALGLHALRVVVEATGDRLASLIVMGR